MTTDRCMRNEDAAQGADARSGPGAGLDAGPIEAVLRMIRKEPLTILYAGARVTGKAGVPPSGSGRAAKRKGA